MDPTPLFRATHRDQADVPDFFEVFLEDRFLAVFACADALFLGAFAADLLVVSSALAGEGLTLAAVLLSVGATLDVTLGEFLLTLFLLAGAGEEVLEFDGAATGFATVAGKVVRMDSALTQNSTSRPTGFPSASQSK